MDSKTALKRHEDLIKTSTTVVKCALDLIFEKFDHELKLLEV